MRIHKVSRRPGELARWRRSWRELQQYWESHCPCCDDSYLYDWESDLLKRLEWVRSL